MDLLDAALESLRRKGLLNGKTVASAQMLLEERDGSKIVTAQFVTFDTAAAAMEYIKSLNTKGGEDGERKG